MSVCSIAGCGVRHYGKGFCSRHYQRMLRNGDPLVEPSKGPERLGNVFHVLENAVFIELSNTGKIAVVDVHKFYALGLEGYTWYEDTDGYARAKHLGKSIKLHQVVHGKAIGLVSDHISQDKLDNRESNLRFCTRQQNGRNTSKPRAKKGLKVCGVAFRRKNPNRPFSAQIRVDGKAVYVGAFSTLEEALAARIAAEKKHFGEFAPQR